MKKNKIKIKIILGIFLLAATFGVVFLAKQNQDNRNKATSSSNYINLYLDSGNKELASNQNFTVPLLANSSDGTGLDSLVAYFCYNPTQIQLEDTTNLQNSFSLANGTSYIDSSIKVNEANNKCVEATFVSVVKNAKLATQAATIKFKTVATTGSGVISLNKEKSSLGVAGKTVFAPDSVGNLSYTIGGISLGASSINLNSQDPNGKTLASNQSFTVPVSANVTGSGLDSVVAYFCYNPTQIRLEDTTNLQNSFTIPSGNSYIGASIGVNETNNKCFKATFVSVVKNGRLSNPITIIKFKTVVATGSGVISLNKEKSSLGVAGKTVFAPDSVGNLSYTIGVGPTCTNGNQKCVSGNKYLTCVNGQLGTTQTACPSNKTCTVGEYSTDVCVNSGTAKLDFDMTFKGIKKDVSKCASNIEVKLFAQSPDGNSNEVTATAVKTDRIKTIKVAGEDINYIIYEVRNVAFDADFVSRDNITLYVTGYEYGQMEYAADGQSEFFDGVTGDLSLTDGQNTKYDFTAYPMLAGDAVGEDEDVPDGKIDSNDFAYIKANLDKTVPDGQHLLGDFDRTCKINSGDSTLLKYSLIERLSKIVN
ncbi:MAG: hypothetical protein WCG91_03840 [Candidatus Shapirobacteria bacterium]